VAEAVGVLRKADHEQMSVNWSLVAGGQAIITTPRRDVIRTWVINHTIHHRSHLVVYLRLLEIPVPGMYGPGGNG
jgi:uncharacterized damage-inducible protein DinB